MSKEVSSFDQPLQPHLEKIPQCSTCKNVKGRGCLKGITRTESIVTNKVKCKEYTPE